MSKPTPASLTTINTSWQKQLSQAVTDPLELLDILHIDVQRFPQLQQASRLFSLKVPHCYIDKIKVGDANDPLLLQIISSEHELKRVPGFNKDPVGDLKTMPVPGLLHKYQHRVLLITTAACAVHCRYCFRRHFPYDDNLSAKNNWREAMEYIHRHDDISEVILSGGDPLILADSKLAELIRQLDKIPHLQRLRIHTRLPVVLPSRITDALLKTLNDSRLSVCVVIHANHCQEIGSVEYHALSKLSHVASLLNQSVLLKGINDSVDAQIALQQRLFHCRVLPYYLHLLDPVEGAAHFDVSAARAIEIMQQLKAKLPGYLVPKLVREIAGKNSKIDVFEL
jgi:EF-P beta-lysylation protein EpmB